MSRLPPPLRDGETVLFNHVPSVQVFKRTALLLLALTLPAVVVILVLYPDTFYPAVPLFVTSVLLAQERVTLGRHRAWITNRRIIMQNDRSLEIGDVLAASAKGDGVRVTYGGGKRLKLSYSGDKAGLIEAIETARQGAA